MRALICSSDSMATGHPDPAIAGEGPRKLWLGLMNTTRSRTFVRFLAPLGMTCCLRPLEMRRPENVRVLRRLEIVRPEHRDRKLARLRSIEKVGLARAG